MPNFCVFSKLCHVETERDAFTEEVEDKLLNPADATSKFEKRDLVQAGHVSENLYETIELNYSVRMYKIKNLSAFTTRTQNEQLSSLN